MSQFLDTRILSSSQRINQQKNLTVRREGKRYTQLSHMKIIVNVLTKEQLFFSCVKNQSMRCWNCSVFHRGHLSVSTASYLMVSHQSTVALRKFPQLSQLLKRVWLEQTPRGLEESSIVLLGMGKRVVGGVGCSIDSLAVRTVWALWDACFCEGPKFWFSTQSYPSLVPVMQLQQWATHLTCSGQLLEST